MIVDKSVTAAAKRLLSEPDKSSEHVLDPERVCQNLYISSTEE